MLYYIASSASFRSKEAQASQLSSCTRLCTFSSLILLAALTFAACGRVGVRAIRDALWHNSLNVAEAFGFPKEAMIIDVEIGVQQPEAVDCDALLKIFPYGQPSIAVVKGGLDVPRRDKEGFSVIANVAIIVSFEMERTHD